MIDEEWLRGLRFDTLAGGKVIGLAGMGGEHVVLLVEGPDGERWVMKTYHHALGFHIKEIPPFMTETPQYDVQRVNEKLARLVGRNDLDLMVGEYSRLHASILNIFHQQGVVKGILAGSSLGVDDELRFFVRTSGVQRRLEEWATMRRDIVDAEDWFMSVNGPNFPIRESRPQLVEWAENTLRTIDQLPNPPFCPDLLHHNPLYVWGGAVMDDFFTDEEFPHAVAFIESRYGRLPTHEHAFEFTMQCGAIADLLSTFLKESKVDRFQRFCAAAGIYFDVRPPRFPQDDDDADNQEARAPEKPNSPSLFQRVWNLFHR